MKLSDLFLLSDVDGTLLPDSLPIPQRNIEAISRFVDRGGKFAIATGRSQKTAEPFVKSLPVNMPCIINNGGGLYDFTKNESFFDAYLPDAVKDDVRRMNKAFPEISLIILTQEDYYHVNREIPFEYFNARSRTVDMKYAGLDELAEPWQKALLVVEPELDQGFNNFVAKNGFKGVRFVRTSATHLEILPQSSDKGSAIKKMVELGLVKREQLVVIGDYYNDIEMIKYAAIGAATAEAPDDIKAVADFIAGPCKDGAVADLIEYLESLCESIRKP